MKKVETILLAVIGCVLTLFPAAVVSKTIEGELQLSVDNIEFVLGAFCISRRKMGHLKLKLKPAESSSPITAQDDVTVRLYRDRDWNAFQKSPASCSEKFQFALKNETLAQTSAEVSMRIDNSKEHRAVYYYIVLTACSLSEMSENKEKVFSMEYGLELKNNGSHVSADELHLNMMHMVTLFVSGGVAMMLALKALVQFYETNQVHASVLWVMVAAASDSLASLFAILHLELYAHDGIGSGAMDSLSCHLEATCDALVALFLLSIGAGWTLPSDVLKSKDRQRILRELQSPFQRFTTTTALVVGIFLAHILLAHWGLAIHNTDFSSYHDFENWPGKILMNLRVVLGACLWVCCLNTKLNCPVSLEKFYNQLGFIGTLWFLSLPLVTWIVEIFQAPHLRHKTIGVWGASLQTLSLLLLSWFVLANGDNKFHKVSNISLPIKESLTERVHSSMAASPSSGDGLRGWSLLGSKAKVRLD